MKSFYALLLAVSLMLGGCSIGPSVVKDETLPFSSPQSALQAIHTIPNGEVVYQYRAKVSVTSPETKMIFKLTVMTQAPDRMRIESIPVFGTPDFFFASQDGHFQVYVPANREFISGLASEENLSRALPLALSWSIRRWVAVLQGQPEIVYDSDNIRGEMDEMFYRIDVLAGDTPIERLWINPQEKHLAKIEYTRPDGLKTTVRFLKFSKTAEREVPLNIDIDTGEGINVFLNIQTAELEQGDMDDLFTLFPPPDTTIRTLPEQ